MIRKQLSFAIENQPGAFARVVLLMAKSGANIEAVNIPDARINGLVLMIVDHPEAAQHALTEAGLPCQVESVVVVRLKNQPGALAAFAARLARIGVSINYMYGSASLTGGGEVALVVSATDLDAVLAAAV